MKSIIEFINEKLHIGSFKKPKELTNDEINDILDKYNNIGVNPTLRRELTFKTPTDEATHTNKMEGYMKKGSKPERLVNSIKDKEKLLKRWNVAMDLGWKEAADIFKQAIIDRGYYTDEELMTWICRKVNNDKDKYKVFLS